MNDDKHTQPCAFPPCRELVSDDKYCSQGCSIKHEALEYNLYRRQVLDKRGLLPPEFKLEDLS